MVINDTVSNASSSGEVRLAAGIPLVHKTVVPQPTYRLDGQAMTEPALIEALRLLVGILTLNQQAADELPEVLKPHLIRQEPQSERDRLRAEVATLTTPPF